MMNRRPILSVSLMVLAACTNGSDDGKGGAGGSGASGATGSTGVTETTGATMTVQQPFISGTRLKVRTLKSDDGAAQQLGFFDDELDLACAFSTATDGTQRCMPIDAAVIGVYFGDASCTVPLAFTSCTTQPAFARTTSSACPPAFAIHQVTGAHTGNIYTGTPQSCAVTNAGTTSTWEIGPEIPAASWVKATESVE